MVDINSSLFIQIANFAVLIAVMNFLLYKPIMNILDQRKEQIDSAENEVKELNLTIQNKMAEYEAQIHQAKLDAMGRRNGIIQEGAEAGKVILDGAKKDITAMMDEFQQKLNAEMQAAKDVLKNRSGQISSEITEKILGRSIQ